MWARTMNQEDQRKGPPARGAGGLYKQNLQSTASKKTGISVPQPYESEVC